MVVMCSYHVGQRCSSVFRAAIAIAIGMAKLTEQRLRDIIKDELERLAEAEWQPPPQRKGSPPTLRDAQELADAAGLYDALDSTFERLTNVIGGDEAGAGELLHAVLVDFERRGRPRS